MLSSLRSRLKTAKSEVSSVSGSLFRSSTARSTTSDVHKSAPRRKRSNAAMQSVLQAMTPPINVNNDNAAQFIHSLIHTRHRPTLSEKDIVTGPTVELYALSYRHESLEPAHRISVERLRMATDVIRSHAMEKGRQFYSIWIDSLFSPNLVNPTATWVDHGLPPYSLFHVVAIPSEGGFTADLDRSWIRCEHQLAANGRGLLMHKSHEAPAWVEGYRMSTGEAHRMIHGASISADQALYALACAVCYGILDGTRCSDVEDVDDLQRWAFMLVCDSWRGKVMQYSTKLCDSTRGGDNENIMRALLDNMSHDDLESQKECRLVTEGLPMIRAEGERRRWDGAVEVVESLSRNSGSCLGTEMSDVLREEIRAKSEGFLLTCNNGVEMGIYVCEWRRGSLPLALELELMNEEDDSKSVIGYRVIAQFSVRVEFARFWDRGQRRKTSEIGEVVCSRERGHGHEIMDVLTDGLLRNGEAVGDQLAVADWSRWYVGMK